MLYVKFSKNRLHGFREDVIWIFNGRWMTARKTHFSTLLFTISHINWTPSSEFVSSSIPSWQILTAHAQPFSGARDLAFCLKVPLDSLLVWASSEGSGETARMRRLAWTFAARMGNKYQIRLTRSNCGCYLRVGYFRTKNLHHFILTMILNNTL